LECFPNHILELSASKGYLEIEGVSDSVNRAGRCFRQCKKTLLRFRVHCFHKERPLVSHHLCVCLMWDSQSRTSCKKYIA
jgi:hypothetical protein